MALQCSNETPRDQQLISFESGIVKVTLGRPTARWNPQPYQTFYAHREVLRRSSVVFKRKLLMAGCDLNFPNGTPKLFSLYLNWLYKGRPEAGNTNECQYVELCKLYRMGCDLEDNKFMNAVVDSLLAKWQASPQILPPLNCAWIAFVPQPSARYLGLGRLLVKIWALTATSSYLTEVWGRLPEDFKQSLSRELIDLRGRPSIGPEEVLSCAFHVHDGVDACSEDGVRHSNTTPGSSESTAILLD